MAAMVGLLLRAEGMWARGRSGGPEQKILHTPFLRQCLIPSEMNAAEAKMEKCVFCGSLNAAGRFVVPGRWICSSCTTRLEEPVNWNTVGCRA